MKRRTQTFLFLMTIACITYFWDIFGMLSVGLPSSHSYPQTSRSVRKPRGLASASILKLIGNESWRQPRWPAKPPDEDQYNQFRGPKSRATKKRVGNITSTMSWHPKALVLQNKKNKTKTGDILVEIQPTVEAPIDKTRYLLPVTLGNQGPNNQLQSVKFCLALALIHNYTLVLPPFFEHQSDKRTVPKQRTFEDTIDWRTLRKIIPVVSVRGFHTACGGKADRVMIGTAYGKGGQVPQDRLELEEYEDQMAMIFGNMTGLTIPSILSDTQYVMDLPEGTPEHFIHIEDYIRKFPSAFNSSSRCNVFVHPYGMLGRFGYRHFNSLFSQYFLRAEYVRTVADKFINQYLGDRFLCLHWRFDKEWVDFWCNQFHEHGRYYCPILRSTPIGEVLRRLLMVLQQYQLNVVYYASPIDPRQDEVLRNLRGTIPYLFTRANILSSSIPGTVWFQGDNYRLSLLEQEICKRSEFFVASELSSWSDMVIEDRQGVSVLRVTDILR